MTDAKPSKILKKLFAISKNQLYEKNSKADITHARPLTPPVFPTLASIPCATRPSSASPPADLSFLVLRRAVRHRPQLVPGRKRRQ